MTYALVPHSGMSHRARPQLERELGPGIWKELQLGLWKMVPMVPF
jgi:hypothetical protein